MVRIFRLLSLALAFSLLPGAAEAVENGLHLLEDGHLAHEADHVARAHDAERHGTDEHGCTPTFHVCHCHAGTPVLLRGDTLALGVTQLGDVDAPLWSDFKLGHDVVDELFRPPRS